MLVPKIFEQFPQVIAWIATWEYLDKKLWKFDFRDNSMKRNAKKILVNDLDYSFSSIFLSQTHSIIYADSTKPLVSWLHSWWRGTQKRIVPLFLQNIQKKWILWSSLYVYLAPSICSKCYEFWKEVIDLFDKKYITFQWGKYFLDVQKVVYDQFILFGVPAENIEVSQYCTYHDKGFYSYRKEGPVWKRMVSAIGLKK